MEKEKNRNILFWLLTILVILIPIALIKIYPLQTILQYGEIYSTVVAFIAFIWFYQSLYLQRIQLQEQREQFKLEFQKMTEANKRENISLAKDILKEAEEDVRIQLEELNLGIDERHLMNIFVKALVLSRNILESENENFVSAEGLNFFKYLRPIKTLLFGIMQAGKIVLENEQEKSIPEMTPEEFVVKYRDKLNSYPFFSRHIQNITLLDDFMLNVKFDVVELATLTAEYIQNPTIFHKDNLDLLLEKIRKRENSLPKITQKYLKITQTQNKATQNK